MTCKSYYEKRKGHKTYHVQNSTCNSTCIGRVSKCPNDFHMDLSTSARIRLFKVARPIHSAPVSFDRTDSEVGVVGGEKQKKGRRVK
jgi:hypothetical protein